MSGVVHDTFTIQRVYPVPRGRVFAAWSDPELKAQWFACHDEWRLVTHELDLRPGGTERVVVQPPDEPAHVCNAHYYDVVANERIVYAYEMFIGNARISVSLVTVELVEEGSSTKMMFTEQGAYLDGLADPAEREEGTRVGLDRLRALL